MSLASSDFEEAGFEETGFDDGLEMPTHSGAAEGDVVAPSEPNYRKQGFSIYTVMLILSFVFLLTAIVMLFMEVGRFS